MLENEKKPSGRAKETGFYRLLSLYEDMERD